MKGIINTLDIIRQTLPIIHHEGLFLLAWPEPKKKKGPIIIINKNRRKHEKRKTH